MGISAVLVTCLHELAPHGVELLVVLAQQLAVAVPQAPSLHRQEHTNTGMIYGSSRQVSPHRERYCIRACRLCPEAGCPTPHLLLQVAEHVCSRNDLRFAGLWRQQIHIFICTHSRPSMD